MDSLTISILDKVATPIIVAAITYTIAKKQITNSGITQFRQKWIDELRNLVSAFIAIAETLSLIDLDDEESYMNHFKELVQVQYKIELMLNPLERPHDKINEIADRIRELIHDEKLKPEKLDQKLSQEIRRLLDATKEVLKQEWNIVKRGK